MINEQVVLTETQYAPPPDPTVNTIMQSSQDDIMSSTGTSIIQIL